MTNSQKVKSCFERDDVGRVVSCRTFKIKSGHTYILILGAVDIYISQLGLP